MDFLRFIRVITVIPGTCQHTITYHVMIADADTRAYARFLHATYVIAGAP